MKNSGSKVLQVSPYISLLRTVYTIEASYLMMYQLTLSRKAMAVSLVTVTSVVWGA